MKINEQLYLVVPLERDDGTPYAHVHILPIPVSAFDVHFQLLIRACERMTDVGGLSFRSARRFIRAAAAEMAGAGGNPDALCAPLLNEVERLATVVVLAGENWETLPLQQALAQGRLEPGDGDEVVNAACFFTVAWHVPPRRARANLIDVGTRLWGAHTSSSPPTAPVAGSQISIATASTGATPVRPPEPPQQGGITVVGLARRA
jgi:hypothetical protein